VNAAEGLDLAGRVARLERDRARVIRAGDRLSLDFWQRVLDRRPWRRVPAGSPLALLYELYGSAGPLLAVGMPRGETPEEVIGGTASVDFQLHAVTAGELVTTSGRWDFALLWRLADGRPWVTEVLPVADDPLGKVPDLGELPDDVQGNLRRPPRPNVRLDPLDGLLWEVETARRGLSLAVRALTAWRAARAQTDVLGLTTEAVAAAVAGATARDSGLRLRRDEVAAEYGADPDLVARTVRRLQPALHSAWR
jgi:hypothetical protein